MLFLMLFATRSHFVVQAELELMVILLPQSPEGRSTELCHHIEFLLHYFRFIAILTSGHSEIVIHERLGMQGSIFAL